MAAKLTTSSRTGIGRSTRGIIDRGKPKNGYFYGLLRITSGSILSIRSNVLGSEKRTRTLGG